MAVTTYCSLPDLKDWIGRDKPAQDDRLLKVIETVSRWIDGHCQRFFGQTDPDVVRVFDTCDPCRVNVSDLLAVAAVKTDENGDGTFEVTWAAGDYQPLPLAQAGAPEPRPFTMLQAVAARRFPVPYWGQERRGRIQVTGTWGWAAVPEPVEEACLIQASRVWMRRQSPQGVIGGFSDFGPVRVSARLDPDVEDLLAYYRHGDAFLIA